VLIVQNRIERRRIRRRSWKGGERGGDGIVKWEGGGDRRWKGGRDWIVSNTYSKQFYLSRIFPGLLVIKINQD